MRFLPSRGASWFLGIMAAFFVVAGASVWATKTMLASDPPCPADGGKAPANPTALALTGKEQIPQLSHVFTIVLENEESTGVLGNQALPYIQQLAAQGAVL